MIKKEEKESNPIIKVCEKHPDYLVPLIWSYAFPGNEYFCPYCGLKGPMLGTGQDVELNKSIAQRGELFEKKISKSLYLVACSLDTARAVMYEGKQIEVKDLPDRELLFFAAAKKAYKFNIKIEDELESK